MESPPPFCALHRDTVLFAAVGIVGVALGAGETLGRGAEVVGDGERRIVLAAKAVERDDHAVEVVNGHPWVPLVDVALQDGRLLGVLGLFLDGLLVCVCGWVVAGVYRQAAAPLHPPTYPP